jgi:hypothetical protein
MARNPREFEDLLKLPPEERLRLANWLIDSATKSKRGGSDSDSSRAAPDENGSRAWSVLRSMTGTLEVQPTGRKSWIITCTALL